jgi:DNA-binding MarR family transcriptional regulator
VATGAGERTARAADVAAPGGAGDVAAPGGAGDVAAPGGAGAAELAAAGGAAGTAENAAAKPAGGDGYPFDYVSAYPAAEISAAWQRERPSVPVSSIEIVTPIWRLAKLLADDRRRVLQACDVDPATLDLLSVLRRAGPPYRLTTREIAQRALVTPGAVSQRVARAERERLVQRAAAGDGTRSVFVTLMPAGHALVERAVDQVLGREAQLVRILNPDERTELAKLLDRLLRDVAEQVGRSGRAAR